MYWLTHNYLTRGFWGDEAWTALIASLPVPEIIRVTGEDFHPPLYYLLVHGFIQLLGASEWIRLISAAFWLLTPIPVYLLMRKSAGKTVAINGAALVLMSPILFTYAFEARAYALLAFLSVVSSLMFWKSMATKKVIWLMAYGLTAITGVYTHYYMWFILLAHGLSWLVLYRQKFWSYAGVFGGIVLVQLPWLPILWKQISTVKQSYWIGPIDNRTHWEWFVRLTGGDFDQPQRMLVVWILLILVLMSLVLVRWKYKRWPKIYIFLWLWWLIPVIIPTVISLTFRPVFFYRYLIFGSIPMLLLVIYGVTSVRKSVGCGVMAFILAFYVTINGLNFGRFPYSMREEIMKISADARKAEMLVTVLPAFAEVMFYSQERLPVRVLTEGVVQFSGKALLDAYGRAGKAAVGETPTDKSYWLIKPGPIAEYYEKK